MTQTSSRPRLLGTLGNLALALLNATLILVALCLLLAYLVMSKVDGLTASFAENLVTVTPLVDEVSATREQVEGLRADIETLADSGGDLTSATAQRLQQRAQALETRLDDMQAGMQDLRAAPQRIIAIATAAAADELAATVTRFTGCVPADRPIDARTPPASG